MHADLGGQSHSAFTQEGKMIVLPWLKDGSECDFIFRIHAKSIMKHLIFIKQN